MAGYIVIKRNDPYYGSTAAATFRVRVHGRVVDTLPPVGTVSLEVVPGKHTVSVSQRWFSSPSLQVTVADNESVTLQAGIPWEIFVLWRILKGCIMPRSILKLTLASSDGAASERSASSQTSARSTSDTSASERPGDTQKLSVLSWLRRIAAIHPRLGGVVVSVGLLVVAGGFGLRGADWPLEAAGGLIALCGIGLNVLTIRSKARRHADGV